MLLRSSVFLFALVAGQAAVADEGPPFGAIITNQVEGNQVAFSLSDDEGNVTAYDVVAAYTRRRRRAAGGMAAPSLTPDNKTILRRADRTAFAGIVARMSGDHRQRRTAQAKAP